MRKFIKGTHIYNIHCYKKLIAKNKKPNDHLLLFEGLLKLCFILCHNPYTFFKWTHNSWNIKWNMLWYSTISCITKMKTKFLLGFIGDMITNGNKHLGTFESPIIHYPIFNVKNLNLMEIFHSKIFNNVLGKEGKK